MEKILTTIEEKINSIDSSIKDSSNAMELILINQHFLKSLYYQPDTINTTELKKNLPSDLLDKLLYIEKLKGWFSKCPNESQIKRGLEYLKEIINYLLQQNTRKIIFLSKISNKYEELKKKYIDLYEKVSKYNDNTYINENEFELIEQLFSDEYEDEEIISFLCQMGRTNALIRIDNESIINIFDEDYDMDELFEEMEKGRNSSLYDSDKLLAKIKNELANKFMLEITINDVTIVQKVIDIFNFVLNIEHISSDMFDEADIFKSEIELINDKDIYMLAYAMLILEALEKKNQIKIKEIIENYDLKEKNNQKISLSDKILNHKIEQLNKIIDEYYVEEEYLKFVSSCQNMSHDDMIKLYGFEKFHSMTIMKLIHMNYSRINKMTLDELDELINKLNFQIAYYEDLQKKIDEEDVEELEGFDTSDVLNYVVFLSKDRIEKNINEIAEEYDGVNISLFPSSLYKLMMIPHSELYTRKTCKPIMKSLGKPNEYEIREERAGSIRVCFKAINTKDGYVVYEILSFAYGSCGDKKKSENLKYALKEYEDHYDEYQKFEQLIKNSTLAELSNIITDGLTVYNEMITDDKTKKVGDNI